jgi:hypothetical protein
VLDPSDFEARAGRVGQLVGRRRHSRERRPRGQAEPHHFRFHVRVLSGRLERLLDVSRPAADQRGDEIARGDVQQATSRTACDRPGEERLADAGRAVQQDAVPVDPVALRVVRVLEHEPTVSRTSCFS